MSSFKKIGYYDLHRESTRGKLPSIIGRKEELARLTRIVNRRINNNCLIVAPSGAGKTTLVRGWVSQVCRKKEYQKLQFIELETNHLNDLSDADEIDLNYFKALAALPPCVLFIDNFGRVGFENSALVSRLMRIYTGVLKRPDIRVIISLQPREHAWLQSKHPAFLQSFETITLKSQTTYEYLRILQAAMPRLNQERHLIVSTTILKVLVDYAGRFPALGQMPRSAISLLDESLAAALALGSKELTEEIIQIVVSGKTGIPRMSLEPVSLKSAARLPQVLSKRIVGQKQAITKIASTIQKALLGMRDPTKPLASFLILGPSGVGKTETVKIIAEEIFGRSESFIRLDMSEFGQEHTVQRLIGAPPGYLGYEAGGALTNALRREPYSLILLDEIEKAHSKVFDIFLQILDSGRLTSGQNETVDARQSIIVATSNIAAAEIAAAHKAGKDIQGKDFMEKTIMPALREIFRLEFLNRFDCILIFNPLSLPALVEIAQLEIKKIESRFTKYSIRFQVDPPVLERKIRSVADSRFGARPIKRFVEETCESLLVKALLSKHQKKSHVDQ